MGFVEPDIFIELARQNRLEIMALQFGLGPIDDPDRAFEPRLQQARSRGRGPDVAQRQEELWIAGLMAEPLIAAVQSGSDGFDLHGFVPIRSCRDRSGVGSEADRIARIAEVS